MAVQIHHAPRHITTLKPAQTLDLIKTAATIFIPEQKKHSLPFLSFFGHPSLFTKCRKAPVYKDLKEKTKHKKGEKEEEDILYVYTQKEV